MCGLRKGALCALLSLAIGSASVLAQAEDAGPLTQLEVMLTTVSSLPESARESMRNEAAAIWRAQGVTVEWLPPAAVRPVSPNRLRVVVVQRRASASGAGEALTVGELLRPLKGHPVAMMSVDSAQRLVASVRGRAGYEVGTMDHRRLGLVLGRALAHEIGHYLLDTTTHARKGLMRPQFNALEFTDLRQGTFTLDPAAAVWLRARLDLGLAAARITEHDRFAYAR